MASDSDFDELLPVNDFVYVKPDVAKEATDGGILVPRSTLDREQGKKMTGLLIAVGPRADLIYYDKDGKIAKQVENADLPMRCIFAEYGGHCVNKPMYGENGEKMRETEYYRVMRSCDVTSILR